MTIIQGEMSFANLPILYLDPLVKLLLLFHYHSSLASDRCLWRKTIYSGIEANRVETAGRNRHERKSRINQVDSADARLTCHECGKACTATIGFISHLNRLHANSDSTL